MAVNEVAKLRFRGGIYEDCALDASAMQVIVKFQDVLTDLAKAIYTASHGKPQSFAANTLVVRHIEQSSTTVSIETTEKNRNLDSEELHQATNLLYETYSAADQGDLLPESLPIDQVNGIAAVIDRLPDDSRLEFSSPGTHYKPISRQACETLRNWVSTSFEEKTTLVGEVYQVDVRKAVCRLFDVRQKRNVLVHYDQPFEDKITTALKNHANQLLDIEGIGVFNKKRKLIRLRDVSRVNVALDDIEQSGSSNLARESIWEFVQEITKDIPEEDWNKLPKDLALNHDDYIV